MILVDLVNSFLVEGYIPEHVIFTKPQALALLKDRFEQNFNALFETYLDQTSFALLFHTDFSEFIVLPLQHAIQQDWVIKPHMLHTKYGFKQIRIINYAH